MENWDDENASRERRAWRYAALIFGLVVLAVILATVRARAEPLPPGKPAGVRQATLRQTELYIFTLTIIPAVVLGVVLLNNEHSATSTGK